MSAWKFNFASVMAAEFQIRYYRPRQSQRASSTRVDPRDRETEQHLLQIDLEDSIYVFPNPSSESAGSSFGSDIATPTDLTISPLSRSRSRHSSNRGGRTRSSSSGHVSLSIRPRFGIEAGEDPELEIDWDTDMDSVAATDESALNMEEADRAHRWKSLTPPELHRVSSSSLWRARQQMLDSSTSWTSSVSRNTHWRHRSVDSDLGPIIHDHHKRIPMLSFIATLLFIDESTTSLLTHPSSESALYPQNIDSDEHPSDENSGTSHGLTKLSAGLEGQGSLREGLTVACDPEFTPLNPFAFHSLQLSGLWSFVNGVWISGGRVLREVWA
ncbi:hypothetical protein PILCRDRAFT_2487 [Piloderma croceum F 1598]|uniref:Uncharacterized protein n=1 Tax=Piloderma croceum (strain F 1598) TaxID=765440 RepID=A0A0C3FYG7_PILCF|nr:hypothetical protein PILCRDRAFT_2487 [Piloderma croceum F 1598]